jgi:prolipoprotein diacylglyceryltransferase
VYTLKVVAGALAAGLWLWLRAPRAGLERRTMRLWIGSVALAALLGGRAGYVLGNAAYFAQHPALILRMDRAGGVHGGSAMLGALVVIGLWALVTRRSTAALLSLLTPAALCVAAGSWWGCAGAGCAWGREIVAAVDGVRWFAAMLPDVYHTVTLRYAVQPLGAAWALILALGALKLRKHAGLVLGLYWLGSAGLTLLRADPAPRWGAVRVDTALDLALAASITLLTLMKTKGTDCGTL